VPVVIGLSDEDQTEILRGDLRPGDQVIVTEQASKGVQASPGPGQMAPGTPRL
jgi:hypothetical protein